MNLFKKDETGYELFAELAKADSSTVIGHAIHSIICSCESKYDFDWLVTQLKDYAADEIVINPFTRVVGKKAYDLIKLYKPFANE